MSPIYASAQQRQRAAANQVVVACGRVWTELRERPVRFGQVVETLRTVFSADQVALFLTAPKVIDHLAAVAVVAAVDAAETFPLS